jgi:hypothetical protein
VGNKTESAVVFELVKLVEASGHTLSLMITKESLSPSEAFYNQASDKKAPVCEGLFGKWAQNITRLNGTWQE